MSNSLYILHALSADTDANLLIEPIAAKFSSIIQDQAASDDLLTDLHRKPYSILFLDSNFSSSYTVHQLFRKIGEEFKNLITILIVDDSTSEHVRTSLGSSPFFYLTHPIQAAEVTFCINHCKTLFKLRAELH